MMGRARRTANAAGLEEPLYQLVVWFDTVTLVITFGALALSFGACARSRLPWLRAYLAYLLCYAIWLLFATTTLFQVAYLDAPVGELVATAWIVRTLAALLVLYAGPAFSLRFARIRIGRFGWALMSIPVAFVFGGISIYYMTASARVVFVPNSFFNLYLALFFLTAALRAEKRRAAGLAVDPLRKAFRPLLWFSVGAYLVLLGVNALAVTAPALSSSPATSVGVPALYCLGLSLLTLFALLGRLRARLRRAAQPPLQWPSTGCGA